MPTMTISQVIDHLHFLQSRFGDVPIVLWDLDSASYRTMTPDNFEAQCLHGEVRISVGINDYNDPYAPHPTTRPL